MLDSLQKSTNMPRVDSHSSYVIVESQDSETLMESEARSDEEIFYEEVEAVEEVEDGVGESEISKLDSAASSLATGAVHGENANVATMQTSAPTSTVDMDLMQLEAQAAKVVHDVQTAAKDVSKKLSQQLWGAVTAVSSGSATSGATPSLSGITSGISSWWASLDPSPAPKLDEAAERVLASSKASSELQALFNLAHEENLVEQFNCKLIQTYACSHNDLTPSIQMAFQGVMYITDRHTCFIVEERERRIPFKVPHTSVVSTSRQRPPRRGDPSDVLRLEMRDGEWVGFKDFENGADLDSALALIEHLVEGA